jgi:hypothetical protein
MLPDDDQQADTGPILTILNGLRNLGRASRVTVDQVLQHFGPASFVPALLVPALIVVSPLSAIFFLPTVMGLTMALIAAQMLIGRRSLWLPGFLLNRSVSGARLIRAADRLDRPARWFDRQTRARFTFLLFWPMRLIPQLGCLISGLMMPFLELVPLSSSLLGGAITLFAVSLLTRDGLFVIGGLICMGIASLIPLAMFAGLF